MYSSAIGLCPLIHYGILIRSLYVDTPHYF